MTLSQNRRYMIPSMHPVFLAFLVIVVVLIRAVARGPIFGRSVNPPSTRGTHYPHPVLLDLPRIFRPCDGPDDELDLPLPPQLKRRSL